MGVEFAAQVLRLTRAGRGPPARRRFVENDFARPGNWVLDACFYEILGETPPEALVGQIELKHAGPDRLVRIGSSPHAVEVLADATVGSRRVVEQLEVGHETELVECAPESLAVVAVRQGAEEVPHLGDGTAPAPTLIIQELKYVPYVALRVAGTRSRRRRRRA